MKNNHNKMKNNHNKIKISVEIYGNNKLCAYV